MLTFSLYLLIGALASTLAGLLGIGGGLLVVPCLALVYALEGLPTSIILPMAAGTSLASMVLTSGWSLAGHRRRGAQIWPL